MTSQSGSTRSRSSRALHHADGASAGAGGNGRARPGQDGRVIQAVAALGSTDALSPTAAPLVFVVPVPPHVTNRSRGSTHWRRAWREKRGYNESLALLLAARMIPPPPPVPIRRAVVASHMMLRGAMDDDNAIARHKPLLDWLVGHGYLATDRRERKKDGASLRWAGLPEQTVSRQWEPFIRLTLTPTEP